MPAETPEQPRVASLGKSRPCTGGSSCADIPSGTKSNSATADPAGDESRKSEIERRRLNHILLCTSQNSGYFFPGGSASPHLQAACSNAMQRYLETTSSGSTHVDGHATDEEEDGGFPEWIAFGVVAVAMALGIITRTTLAKWLP